MQIVDNLVKRTFHGDLERTLFIHKYIQAHKSNYKVQKTCYVRMCNCECGVREQVHK